MKDGKIPLNLSSSYLRDLRPFRERERIEMTHLYPEHYFANPVNKKEKK
jgi:hypothetical protein